MNEFGSASRRTGGRKLRPPFCLMHRRYERSPVRRSRTKLDGVMGETQGSALQAASSRGRRAACHKAGKHRMICHLIANSEYSTCLCVFWRNKRDGGNNCGGRGEGGFTGHRTGVTPLRAQLTASLTHTYTSSHKRPNSPHVKMHRDEQVFFFFLVLLFFLCKRENTFKQRCLAGHWR